MKTSSQAQPEPADNRSPLARGRDAWLASEEGQRAVDVSTLTSGEAGTFLRHRIEAAFLAGADFAAADLAQRMIRSGMVNVSLLLKTKGARRS